MVGALRWPTRPLTPTEVAFLSVKASCGSWQVLHETVPSTERRRSKKSFCPREIFSGVCGLSAGIAARVISTGTPTCASDFGCAKGSASGFGARFGPILLADHSQPKISVAIPAAITPSTKRRFTKKPVYAPLYLHGSRYFSWLDEVVPSRKSATFRMPPEMYREAS